MLPLSLCHHKKSPCILPSSRERGGCMDLRFDLIKCHEDMHSKSH